MEGSRTRRKAACSAADGYADTAGRMQVGLLPRRFDTRMT